MPPSRQKYYALHFPKNNYPDQVLTQWSECQQILKQNVGGRVKSFPDLSSAKNYLSSLTKSIPEAIQQQAIRIYVDGSFNPQNSYAGWGWVALDYTEENILAENKGRTLEPAESRNIDGELTAVVDALKKVTNMFHGKPIIIYYDYQGIESWFTGEWKSKSKVSQQYAKAILPYQTTHYQALIYFQKVTAHTGDKWNDYVDELAKSAIT